MSVFITSLVIWLLLTGFSYSELLVGVIVSIFVAVVLKSYHGIKYDWKLIGRFLKFVFVPR